MRNFYLVRMEDVSGMSGTGKVGEGIEFSNGMCAFTWLNPLTSINIYSSIDDLDTIHSHGGRTRVVYLDEIRTIKDNPDDHPPELIDILVNIKDRRVQRMVQATPPPTWEEVMQVQDVRLDVQSTATQEYLFNSDSLVRRVQEFLESLVVDEDSTIQDLAVGAQVIYEALDDLGSPVPEDYGDTLTGRAAELKDGVPDEMASVTGYRQNRTTGILLEILSERLQQQVRWGDHDHADGISPSYMKRAEEMKALAEEQALQGNITWNTILQEEVFEALSADAPDILRRELIQVAAVATAWIEAIDTRADEEQELLGPTQEVTEAEDDQKLNGER